MIWRRVTKFAAHVRCYRVLHRKRGYDRGGGCNWYYVCSQVCSSKRLTCNLTRRIIFWETPLIVIVIFLMTAETRWIIKVINITNVCSLGKRYFTVHYFSALCERYVLMTRVCTTFFDENKFLKRRRRHGDSSYGTVVHLILYSRLNMLSVLENMGGTTNVSSIT